MAQWVRRAGLVIFGWMVVSLNASAQSAQVKENEGNNGSYGYEFSDDPLGAGGFGPNDATIRVRPGPVRKTLIQPRTSFVPEMLKSVEHI